LQDSFQPTEIGRRFGGRTIAGLVLLVLTIILIGTTTAFSWWNLSTSSGATSAWYLGTACSGNSCQNYQGYPAIHDAFGLANALVLTALGLAIFTLVLFVLSIFWPRVGIGTLITGLIGSLLLLASPIYLFFALPGAMSASGATFVTGFFGSYTQSGFFGSTTYTWGGGTGWYLAIVVSAIFFVSMVLGFSASRHLAPLGNFRLPPTNAPTPSYNTASYGPPPGMPPPARASELFCPVCGSRYPAGTQYCSRDATPLKEVPPR